MITAPFELPAEREKVIEKLSAGASAPHGGMMGGGKPDSAPDAEAVWKSLAPTPAAEAKSPLVFYVHIPFCIARCAFCGFYRNQTDEEEMENYTRHLLTEIDRVADEGIFTKRPVDIVYFGGGTPTALSAEQLRRLITRLHKRFTISPKVEFTVEGRIFGFDDDRVRACVDSGANRFSFGVQSFETDLRRLLGRRNSREELLDRLSRIKEICGDRAALVADLIYGLPGQTQEDWMLRNVKTAHESALDGVDIYSLKIFPGSPIEKMFDTRGGKWSEEERIRRHAGACDYLVSAGWKQLSTTHFGRNALERNLYNHWAMSGAEMVPFGCGAGGNVGGWSIMQTGDLADYLDKVDKGLKPIGMCMKVPPTATTRCIIAGQLGYGWFEPASIPQVDYTPVVKNWEAAGVWAEAKPGRWRLTRLGEYFQPKVVSMLMGYTMANSMSVGDALKMAGQKLMAKMRG
ncbi:MAG: radical SAM protein [Kiritimatiellae bacterium]|nr:radical SAM protein [Kiritimatiellia bacterium]